MADKLEVLITAKDEASGVFKSLGKTLKTGLAIGAGVAVAGVGALVAGLGFSVKEAMAAEEVQAQLGAVLKSTGGAAGVTADMANELANELMYMSRYEDDAILSGENMLLTFTNIGKNVFPQATQAMLDLSTATGQDLQSSAVQLGKALNDPIAGITALQRVGVTFSEEQKKVIEALMLTGDIAGAQKVILAELNKEFGGSAQAAGETFAGQLDMLKNSLGNVGEEIGMVLMPALTDFISNSVTPFVQEYGPKLAAWMGENLPKAIQFLSDFWTGTLLPAITTVWNWMSTVLIPFLVNEVYPWLQVNIPKALQTLSNFWTNTLQPAIQAVWGWMSTVLIPFLVNTVFPWLQVNIPKALQTLSTFWTTVLQPAIAAVWSWMSTVLIPFIQNVIVPWLQVKIPAALAALAGFWTSHRDEVSGIVQGLWDGIMNIWNTFKADFESAFELWSLVFQGDWRGVGEKLREIVDTAWSNIKTAVSTLVEDIKDFFTETDWVQVGKDIITGLGNGIGAMTSWIKEKALAIARAVLETLKGFFGVKSPSKVMHGIGINLMQGLAQGITGGQDLPAYAMAGAAQKTVNSVYNYTLNINEAGRTVDPLSSFEMLRVLAGA